MALSHRDHRLDRTLVEGFVGVLALVVGGLLFASLAPWAWLGLLAVAGLGVGAAVYVVRANRLVRSYVEDVRAVRGEGPVDGWVRYEVENPVPVQREVGRPTERSPHSRRPGGATGSRD